MARSLLLISTLAALVCVALGDFCSSASSGDISGVPLISDKIKITGSQGYQTSATETCAKLGKAPVGVKVSACSDKTVTVKIINLDNVFIATDGNAEIQFIIYCAESYRIGGTGGQPRPNPVVIGGGRPQFRGDVVERGCGNHHYSK